MILTIAILTMLTIIQTLITILITIIMIIIIKMIYTDMMIKQNNDNTDNASYILSILM